ncbi:MAG TPA: LptF/LptG family permease [Blastocatellia bacterium]|nr:LptF/LptG family permease [Blastocatellia bacterium]
MLRLIDRSILREVTSYLILAVIISMAILLAAQIADFGELFIKRNVPPGMIRTLLASLVPRVLVITIPLSLLVGVMTGLGRMTADHETTALFAAGVSRSRIVLPLILLGGLLSLILLILLGEVLPRSYRQFQRIRAELLVQGLRTQMKARVFDDRFVNKVLYIGDIDRRSDRWSRLLLIMREGSESSPLLITAKTGILQLGDVPETSLLRLEDGMIHRRTLENGHEQYEIETFDRLFLRFDAKSREAIRSSGQPPSVRTRLQQMTLGELLRPQKEDPALSQRRQIELHKRLALSLSPVIFGLLGSVLGLRLRRMTRGAGLTTALLLACVYYLLLLAGENLSRAGTLPPALGLWMANGIFLALATRVYRRGDVLPGVLIRLVEIIGELRSRVQHLSFRLSRRAPLPHSVQGPPRAAPLILDRYLAGRFLSSLLPALVGLWVLFLVFTLFELASDIIAHRIPAHIVAEYCLYLTPVVGVYLLPPAALLATMVCFSLLSRTSELVAFKASGISIYRTTAPVIAICCLLTAAVFLGENSFLPRAYARQDALRFYIKQGRSPQHVELAPAGSSWIMSAEPWQQTDLVPPTTYRVYHFRSFDRWAQRLDFPFIVELDPLTFAPRARIEARSARWDRESQQWIFSEGRRWQFDGSHVTSQQSFSSLALRLPEQPEYFTREPLKPDALTISQLTRYIRYLAQTGTDTTELEVTLHRKSALAVACLVMGLFGIPFGIATGRHGALQAVGLGIGLGLTYWLLLDIFSQMGKYGYFSPAVAAWAPCGLLGAGGLYALFRLRS